MILETQELRFDYNHESDVLNASCALIEQLHELNDSFCVYAPDANTALTLVMHYLQSTYMQVYGITLSSEQLITIIHNTKQAVLGYLNKPDSMKGFNLLLRLLDGKPNMRVDPPEPSFIVKLLLDISTTLGLINLLSGYLNTAGDDLVSEPSVNITKPVYYNTISAYAAVNTLATILGNKVSATKFESLLIKHNTKFNKAADSIVDASMPNTYSTIIQSLNSGIISSEIEEIPEESIFSSNIDIEEPEESIDEPDKELELAYAALFI